MIDGGLAAFVPGDAKAADFSSVDVDLTAVFAGQAYCRGIYNGAATAASFKVTTVGGNTPTYANVPSGGHIYGLFTLLWHTGSTANAFVNVEK